MILCDCSIRVTAILEYIESVVPHCIQAIDIPDGRCDRHFLRKPWSLKSTGRYGCYTLLAKFSTITCSMHHIYWWWSPVQYICSSSSTLNNVVVSKFGAQGKFWYGKWAPLYVFAAWRRRRAYRKIKRQWA